MSDGISAAWDDAEHYEQLCKEHNEEIRYSGPGPWPYNMDSKHYDQLKARKGSRDDVIVTTHEWRYSDSSSYDSVCVVCGCTDISQSANLPCTINEPAIRLVRPLQIEYMTVGKVIRYWGNDFYKITEQQFVDQCMKESGGGMHPLKLIGIYHQLMSEAGL